MSITIGDAVLWIRGKNDKLPDDLAQSEGQVKGWAGRIGESMKGAISVAAGQLIAQGLNQISQGLENLAKDVMDTSSKYIREVEEMARATGATSEEASRMIQVADDQRVSVEELTIAIRTYSQHQAQAGRSVQINVDELGRLSDQYLKLAPGTERNAFLMDNFGRSGLNMARMMEQGSAALKEFSAGVEDNLIITQEAIDAQREYEMAMDDLNDATTGLKIELGRALTPVLKDLIEFLKSSAIPALKALVDMFVNLPKAAQYTIVALALLLMGAAKAGPSLLGLVGIVQILAGGGGMAGLATAISTAATAVWGFLVPVIAAALPFIALAAAIGALIYVIINFGPQAWTALKQLLYIVGYYLSQLVSNIVNWAKTAAKSAGEWFKTVGTSIVNGIWEGIQAGWTWLTTQVQNLAQSLLDAIKKKLGISSPSKIFMEIGRSIPESMMLGMDSLLPELAAKMQLVGSPVMGVGAGGGTNISGVRIENHGRISQEMVEYLDRRSIRHSEELLMDLFGV